MTRRIALAGGVGGLLGTLSPSPAAAHLVGIEFGDFYAGAIHLLIAPEHLVMFLALALVLAVQRVQIAQWALLGLPIGLAVGVGAGALAATEEPTALLGLSLALIGLVGAIALKMRIPLVLGAAFVIGTLHGYANGLPASDGRVDFWLYASGVVVAGTVVGTLAIAGATALLSKAAWVGLGFRVLSGWIVAVGAMYTGLALTA